MSTLNFLCERHSDADFNYQELPLTPPSFPAGPQHSCAKGTGFFLSQEGQAVPGRATFRDAEPGPTGHPQVGSLGLRLRLPRTPFPHVICTWEGGRTNHPLLVSRGLCAWPQARGRRKSGSCDPKAALCSQVGTRVTEQKTSWASFFKKIYSFLNNCRCRVSMRHLSTHRKRSIKQSYGAEKLQGPAPM